MPKRQAKHCGIFGDKVECFWCGAVHRHAMGADRKEVIAAFLREHPGRCTPPEKVADR